MGITALHLYIAKHPYDSVDSNGNAPSGDAYHGIDKINGSWRELRTPFCMGGNMLLEAPAPAEVSTHGRAASASLSLQQPTQISLSLSTNTYLLTWTGGDTDSIHELADQIDLPG